MHVHGLAGRHGRDEAPEVLHGSSGERGIRGEPGLLSVVREKAGLAQEQLRLPRGPEARGGVSDDGEAQPAVLGEHPLALLALVVGQAPAGAPQAHVVHGERGRHAGERRVFERLRRDAGQLGQEPEHGRPAGLGDRQIEDAQLRQHDRPQLDVLGEWKSASPGSEGARVALVLGWRRRRLGCLEAVRHFHVGSPVYVTVLGRTEPVGSLSCTP